MVLYGYADASQTGFGSSFITLQGLQIRYGLWGRDISHQSSNFRELRNVADAVEWELVDRFPILLDAVDAVSQLIQAEVSPGLELFLFTDNIVAESAFFRGTSSNPLLFDIILRLKRLELEHSLYLYIVHIAGTCMMAQGTDGLSRGVAWERDNPLSFVPLHLSPCDRDPQLLPWVASWIPPRVLFHPLLAEEWFTIGHGWSGQATTIDGFWYPTPATEVTVIVWHPALAAAEAALEELCLSRHKRPYLRHIFLCPRLFTHAWHKRLFKFADMVFYLSSRFLPGVWTSAQHEPVIVGIFLPLLNRPPWCAKGTPPVLAIQHRLRTAFATRDSNLYLVLSDVWSCFCP
jgi:hypothetical protein